jgi:hypothetical protein
MAVKSKDITSGQVDAMRTEYQRIKCEAEKILADVQLLIGQKEVLLKEYNAQLANGDQAAMKKSLDSISKTRQAIEVKKADLSSLHRQVATIIEGVNTESERLRGECDRVEKIIDGFKDELAGWVYEVNAVSFLRSDLTRLLEMRI